MDEFREIPVDKIRVGRRTRGDCGDLTALVSSLRRYGQIHPIVVSEDLELIAGRRRLEAARRLGWQTIAARVTGRLSATERLELELEENVQRLALTTDEMAAGFARLERKLNPGPATRLARCVGGLIRKIFRVRGR
jgi:ParB family chromosome partitioning protein